MGKDYYKLLGIDKNANDDEVKKAYKKMVCCPAVMFCSALTMLSIGVEMASR